MTISKHTADAVGKEARARSTHVIPLGEGYVNRRANRQVGTAPTRHEVAVRRTGSNRSSYRRRRKRPAEGTAWLHIICKSVSHKPSECATTRTFSDGVGASN